MSEPSKHLNELLIKKRDVLSKINELCNKEVEAAQNDNWSEFNQLAELFNSLSKEVDALDKLLNERFINDQPDANSKITQELLDAIQTLVRDSLRLQKDSSEAINKKKVQALRQLQVMDKKNDAIKAYGRPSSYLKSVPRFVDDKK